MSRYSIDCTHCREHINSTDDPREAYDMAQDASDGEHGNSVDVTARGLVNRWAFNRANKDR